MLTKDNFKEKLQELYQGKIEPLEEYKNARTTMKFFCHNVDDEGKEHGEFTKTPYELITLKRPCRKCMGLDKAKPNNYWNNKENCIEEAKKYKNKWELQRKCYGCYGSFMRHNWIDTLNEIYKDVIIMYSNPNDKIHCIYVYDISEFKTCYVGRTNNIKRRDKQHRNGFNHTNGIKTYDNLWKFCNERKIEMPQPIILEENLNAEESQIQEHEWLQKYISNGYEPINKAPTGKNLSSLGATMKWTYEECKKIAEQCHSKEEMKKLNQSAHNSARKNGWIDEFFENVKKLERYWLNFENLQNAALTCRGVKEFSLKCGGAYNAARKLGVLKDLKFKNN